MYCSPRNEGKKTNKAIIVFSDVFGWQAGNHRLFCDALSKGVGDEVDVFLPDFFRGNNAIQPVSWLPEMVALPLAAGGMIWRLKFTYTLESVIGGDCARLVVPHLKNLGYEELGCVGFCFGGWAVAQCLAMDSSPFKCGVGIHPSLNVERMHGRKEVDLAKKIGKKPIFFMPAGNDKEEVKPGGSVVKMIATERGVEESEVSKVFNDMVHGWVSRGAKEVAERQKEATNDASLFFKKHL